MYVLISSRQFLFEHSAEVIYPGFNEQEIETIDMDLDEIEAQTVVTLVM